MRNDFILRITLSTLFILFIIVPISRAQDSIKRTTTVKKPVVKPIATKPGAVPINPKTGKPYTKYGYGTYAKTYKAQHTADSLKKAAALKATQTPVVTTPATVVPPVDKPVAVVPVDKSLNGQYQYLLTKIYNYQRPYVDAIWKTFRDTLNNTRNELKDTRAKLDAQNKTINGLKTDMTDKEETLSTATTKADSISFLGADMSKSTYNLMMWGLVIVFGVLAGVVIAQSGGYRREATYRTKLYSELEDEFKTYKNKANEKEKKLARELQTERNKVDELMGRG